MKTYQMTLIRTERYTTIVSLDDDVDPDKLSQRERESIIDNGTHTQLQTSNIAIGHADEIILPVRTRLDD